MRTRCGLPYGRFIRALLREVARRIGLDLLSMGMSADFEKAVGVGAAHVRAGTAIFGARGEGVDGTMPVAPESLRTLAKIT